MSFLEVTWTDEVTGRRGYLVIDRVIRGAASGGLRMREGCTLDEVRDLARGMTLKEAVVYSPGDRYVPFGGGKGGIDCSPYDPDARGVMKRYVAAMKPLIERYWSTGEDFGVRQDVLDEVAVEVGLRSTIEAALALLPDPEEGLARVKAGFAVEVDGVGLGDLAGGYGVAEAALAAAARIGLLGRPAGADPEPGVPRPTAFVQGFGSMGGATARFLHRGGVPVVGICDADGVVANPAGLDVERLLLTRDAFGCVDRGQLAPGDVELPRDAWLSVRADILVPAAMSYVITEENAHLVNARLVVEAANVPTTPEAEAALAARGVTVIPDFVANVATNAWWWWTLFGDIEADADSAFAKISATLRALVDQALEQARQTGATPREAARAISAARLDSLLRATAPAS
ncbi:MAG TPA: Glu/Leu/Phe/Val dehydrogenase dimerization domain-containing protein [Micromonosporaceae bacterium]|nr:Glu/Leu/Phe/Val dehydrogenase dimerization domain-containing protein [Micromonosporaceae bacterium]